LRALCRKCGKNPTHSIVNTLEISNPTLNKLTKLLNLKMESENQAMSKLGGIGKTIHIDETMMNFKIKSHRGRAPSNNTNALCIVEVDNTTRRIEKVWAEVLPNIQAQTILPIIHARVVEFSVIHTDEHRSYSNLNRSGFIHPTVTPV
jgi:hypothetical protein